jgi:NADPH-dependent curcumin reductase CurA
MSYQTINPYNGELLQSFEELTEAQLEAALATAQACFEQWRERRFAERAGNLKSLETVVVGIDQAAKAFIGLLNGKNVGNMVVKL